MGKWSLGDVALTVGTGGVYGLYKGVSDQNKENQSALENERNAAMDLYNKQTLDQGRARADQLKQQYYGNTLQGLGGETEDYVSRMRGNLDKNVAKADIYNQQAARERGIQNTKAGLSGVDTTAMNEQSRRNAVYGAASINEDAKRQALDLYGTSIGNRIKGANTIDQSEMATAIASMKQPETNYNPGLIGSLFSGFV